MKMDKEFARAAYDSHHALFRHYSEQIFKTRVYIVSIIILFFGYLLGVVPLKEQPVDPVTTAMLAYLTAILVALLFSVETAYYRRLTQVAGAARRIEESQSVELYFRILDKVSHWQLYGLYCAGVVAFLAIALGKFYATPLWSRYKVFAIALLVIPLALASRTVVGFSTIARQGLSPRWSPDPNREDKSDGAMARSPNYHAAPDANRASRGGRR